MFDNHEYLGRSLDIVRIFVSKKLKTGDVAVDATAGNGHDTLFLAQCVGAAGKVYSFDIQLPALERSRQLLADNKAEGNVIFIQDGHQHLDRYVTERISVVLFNLGYLPGGNKQITTQAHYTIEAIEKALDLLAPGGAIFLVVYYGQPPGPAEKDQLLAYAKNLDQQKYNVFYLEFINQANNPPSLLSIEKRV